MANKWVRFWNSAEHSRTKLFSVMFQYVDMFPIGWCDRPEIGKKGLFVMKLLTISFSLTVSDTSWHYNIDDSLVRGYLRHLKICVKMAGVKSSVLSNLG